jgi:hypothetical protein
MSERISIGLVAVGLAFVVWAPNGLQAETIQIPTVLNCGPLSSRPHDRPEFTASIQFNFVTGSLTAERKIKSRPGREVYEGSVSPDGAVNIKGIGRFLKDRSGAWTTVLSGQVSDVGLTTLRGHQRGTERRNGERSCSLVFQETSSDLRVKFGLSKGGSAPVAAGPPSVPPPVTKSELAKPTAAPTEVSKPEPDRTISATSQKWVELTAKQQEQAKAQAETAKRLGKVERVLGDIILPITERPADWMMRVAAVPVQQQQFCRIVDRFYDDIDRVYQARNDIKRNSLFRDRQTDMATLLPGGVFENWVVRIIEVTQAPDGTAAVMLQPPCRAMLGSDACQKDNAGIRATIEPNSPMFRELERVSAGDFVVVSGLILYAQRETPQQPLPTYALYQAGSHCSKVEGGKKQDVFVTEIRYLVQLR